MKKDKKTGTSEYSAKHIQLLDGISHIRKRPSMYISTTDKDGVYQLLKEAIDNGLDESTNGHAKNIWVWISNDCNTASVRDDGRGIPVEKHPQTKESTLTTVLTRLQAGGKFDDKAYSTSAGLHGVGIKATNALSETLIATTWRDGKCYKQEFKRGKPITKVKKITRRGMKHGTEILFKPDAEIFKVGSAFFDAKDIKGKLQSIVHLCPGLIIHYEHKGKALTFVSKDGLGGYVKQQAKRDGCTLQHEPIVCEAKTIQFAIAWANWTDESWVKWLGFVNASPTPEGGTHVNGLKRAIHKALTAVYPKYQAKADDFCDNMYAAIHVKVKEPKFKSQTKTTLNNPEVEKDVENVAYEHLVTFFTKGKGKKLARIICERAIQLGKLRDQTRKLRQAANTVNVDRNDKGILIDKLAACDDKCPVEERELFIVEGESAGGTATAARNIYNQMVLKLKGKILNSQRVTLHKTLDNKEIQTIIQTVGIKLNVKDQSQNDLSHIRVGKILLMMDADPDGRHIASLALTFIAKHAWQLIENGMVYVVQSPLFKASSKDGKHRWYANSLDELKQVSGKDPSTLIVSRLKGLGEMNKEELEQTSMNVKTRSLIKVRLKDNCRNKIANIMGEDSNSRKILLGIDDPRNVEATN